MKSVDQIYRERLTLLCSRFGTQARLAEAIGKSPAQVSQWINASKDSRTGKPRAMDRSSAREIESRLSLPSGWMDQPLSNGPDAELERALRLKGISTSAPASTIRYSLGPSIDVRAQEPTIGATTLDWRTAAVMLARQCQDGTQRELLLEFIREVDGIVAESAQTSPIRAKFVTP